MHSYTLLQELKPSLTAAQASQLESTCALYGDGLRRVETVETILQWGLELLPKRQQAARGRSGRCDFILYTLYFMLSDAHVAVTCAFSAT